MAADNKDGAPVSIPILRTYEGDVYSVAQTKGGGDLRQILVKEMEEKKKAQEEYRRKMQDLMKESLVLKDRKRSFLQGFRRKKDNTESVARDFDRQQIDNTVSGALAYLDPHAPPVPEEQKEGTEGKPPQTAMFPQQVADSAEKEKPEEVSGSPPVPVADIPDQKRDRENLGAGAVEGPPEVDPTEDIVGVAKQQEPKQGIFSRLRKEKQNPVSEERRSELQQKQEEVVEKESIRKAWKDFSKKKVSLQQLGLEARDVRSYDPNTPASPLIKKQNLIAIVFVAVVLGFMVFIVASVTFSGEEPPVITLPEASSAVPDILVRDELLPIDVSLSTESWESIARKRSRNDLVTKYVPYVTQESERTQIDLSGLLQTFSVSMPRGLQNTLGNYYFIGNYTDRNEANGIFVVPVKNYSDTLVWILNWESQIMSAFQNLFPGMISEANPVNVSVQPLVVDNKDVRVLRHESSRTDVIYYFFDRSTLVFIVGDITLVERVNERIRQSNTIGL